MLTPRQMHRSGRPAIPGTSATVAQARPAPPSLLEQIVEAGLLIGGGYIVGSVIGAALQYMADTPEERSIRSSAHRHERQGATVCADHVGWDCVPPILNGRRPDVYADYGDKIVVEEHETEESVNRGHSIQQDRDLRTWTRRRPHARYHQVIAS